MTPADDVKFRAKVFDIAADAILQNGRMHAALVKVRDELRERIDGAEESRNRDAWISDLILTCEAAL